MELKEFIGKTVIHSQTKSRFALQAITAPYIDVTTVQANASGHHPCYRHNCMDGDPISNGVLVFEDAALTEPFKRAYNAHCRSEAGRWEDYGYWLRRG